MDFVVAIVSSIVAKSAEYTISPIINHVKYLSNHQQNVETLKHQAEKLKVARDRVQHSVDAALRNGKEIEGDVDKWLSAVDTKILEQVEKVTQDEEKAKKKCFVGLCPDFWTRYKLSLNAPEEAKAVAELLEQGKFDEVSYPVPLQGITVTPFKGYEDFESRTLVLNEIMEALKDDSVSVIGVHGMGGIGKTTLVKEIARKVKGNLFDSVVIATVTQAIDIEKIQNRISELLGLKFEEQSTDVKALRLQERLKKEKRVLVVLDDIWAKVDIEEVGIPLGDEHKGCKLLLTSRELNVLSNGMDAQKYFSVGVAHSHCDSCRALRNKRLFEWKNALRELERPSSSNFTGIAAAYSAIEWSFNYLESEEVKLTFLLCCVIGHNGLVEKLMRYIVGLGLFGGVNTMEEARNEVLTVVANLKASSLLLDSYDDEHFDIHDVVSDAALAIASRDYHMLVLRDHIPKEWSDKAKMNSLRAISLPCPQIIVELPKEIEYSGLSFFHMAHDDSVVIPPDFFRGIESLKVLDLPSYSYLPESINHLIDLRMLCLRGCLVEDITIIGELKSLEILDLAFSRIKELPKEIAQLTRLRLLDLSWCEKLKIIPPNVLSSLSKLEELYMEGSFVEWENGVVDNERRNASLDELNNLSRLTTLYVRISDIQMIPKHRFIETLNRYRIIVGDHPISKWLRRHECSRTLTLQLYTNICLDNGVKMLLGKAEYLYLDLKGLKGIKNVLAELNKGNDFPHLQSLHVKNGIQVQYITMNNIEFSELRFITLERLPQLISFCCQEERCSTSFEPLPLFIKQTYHWSSNLRRLIITGCGKLEHLLSPSVARNLVQLHCFEIVGCESLREIIFTEEIEEEEETSNVISSIAKHLPQLEHLWIRWSGVEEIVLEGEGLEEQPVSFEFPKVSSLTVEHLEKLKCFYKGQHTIVWPMLKKLTTDCSALLMIVGLEDVRIQETKGNGEAVLLVKEVIPNLEKLELRNFSAMDQLPPDLFPRVKVFEVGGGFHSGSSYIFPLVRRFYNLERLKFSNFDFKHVVPCKGAVGTLSPIKNLKLHSSKNLKHIWRKDSELGHILSNLQTLTISHCDDLKNIGASSLSFQNLTTLEVSYCKMMTNLLTPLIVENLVQLTTMKVSDCTEMTEIVTNEGDYHQTIVVRKLKCLEISDLQRLTSFCPGSYTFNFPCLEEVVVERCPRLKGGFNSPFDLNISDTFPKLIEIWKRNPQEILESKNLGRIEIYKCSSLKYIFAPSMLFSLKQLEQIEVKECNTMEQVIREDEEGVTIHTLTLPKLSFVKIEVFQLDKFLFGKSTS
ncbi:probable disease resistance protein At4g27220 [Gossypium arboreum]|uniref:probable disease resistance protein At4g27220 n=1 Tax=Gossypium arboreum TaxID=29729 RepID=UPI0022F15340|nr:probable disease resistance protein At4g27220 [Gossypium arboreum]